MKEVAYADIASLVGQEIGVSDWVEISQERVNQFAEATGDHQWIHVDVERAKTGPFGGTIAHGYLTLSLAPALLKDIIRWENIAMGVNYGLNKVRFTSPVPVGSRLRGRLTLLRTYQVARWCPPCHCRRRCPATRCGDH